jgi:proline iminopeptidase
VQKRTEHARTVILAAERRLAWGGPARREAVMELDTPYSDGMLDVGDGHAIYWRTQGNPDAPPIVVLHGGPGGAMNVHWAEFLDATQWRFVFFDQRGCGRSTPFGELRHNRIADLVSDIEKLREHLGVERWSVFGGSWGTTLALAYGAAHPERCGGFLLRGIYLARNEDTEWFLWDVRRLYPDVHAAFLDAIEKAAGRRPSNAREVLALTEVPLARFDAAGTELARAWRSSTTHLSKTTKRSPMTNRRARQSRWHYSSVTTWPTNCRRRRRCCRE